MNVITLIEFADISIEGTVPPSNLKISPNDNECEPIESCSTIN